MTDEQDIRALLTRAAELPDSIQAPVARLLEQGRRKRLLRTAVSAVAACAVAAAAIALPPVLAIMRRAPAPPVASQHRSPPTVQVLNPTAEQISRFRWSSLAGSPLGVRLNPVLAWTGNELLEIGGTDAAGHPTSDGAAFDPATGRWRMIAPIPPGVGTSSPVSVWTGRQLFVTNGQPTTCAGNPGPGGRYCARAAGLFDPAANRWTTTPLPAQLRGSTLRSAAWTGREVILAGADVGHRRLAVAAYEPATRNWQMITPALPSGHPPISVAMVATNRRVILWSLWARTKKIGKNGLACFSGIDVLATPSGGASWTLENSPWPQHETIDDPSYAGNEILVPPGMYYNGLCSSPGGFLAPHLTDARTLAMATIPDGPWTLPSNLQPDIWLWNGSAAVATITREVAGPNGARLAALIAMAAYDPVAHVWHSLPVPPESVPLAADPLWAGREELLLTASGGLFGFHR